MKARTKTREHSSVLYYSARSSLGQRQGNAAGQHNHLARHAGALHVPSVCGRSPAPWHYSAPRKRSRDDERGHGFGGSCEQPHWLAYNARPARGRTSDYAQHGPGRRTDDYNTPTPRRASHPVDKSLRMEHMYEQTLAGSYHQERGREYGHASHQRAATTPNSGRDHRYEPPTNTGARAGIGFVANGRSRRNSRGGVQSVPSLSAQKVQASAQPASAPSVDIIELTVDEPKKSNSRSASLPSSCRKDTGAARLKRSKSVAHSAPSAHQRKDPRSNRMHAAVIVTIDDDEDDPVASVSDASKSGSFVRIKGLDLSRDGAWKALKSLFDWDVMAVERDEVSDVDITQCGKDAVVHFEHKRRASKVFEELQGCIKLHGLGEYDVVLETRRARNGARTSVRGIR